MFKRISVFLLALCCAFCFISQPVAAVSTGTTLLGVLGIGMVVAGAFGITYVNNSGYESFGSLLQSKVISSPAGAEWWNLATNGTIILSGLDASVKDAIWSCAKQAADSLPQTGQDQYTYEFTTSSYTVTSDGSISSYDNYSGKKFTATSAYGVPIYCLEAAYSSQSGSFGYYIIKFISSKPFYCNGKQAKIDGLGCYEVHVAGYSISDIYLRRNCTYFSSSDDLHAYVNDLISISSEVQSSGGATAAYPTYGYDGVNLPNIDLKKAGLIAEDGTSTVSDLIAQLQSGAITWEDYIGTVAPGQTATITITDENGAAVTYTLVNTGVGTRVEPGTDVTEATEPIVVPAPGELTGTLADTDAKTFIDSIAKTIAKPFADVIEKVQAIPSAITEALSKYKPASSQDHFTIDLKEFFPFCIPFDLYDFFSCLNAAPVAPVIDWAIPLPGGEMYPMKLGNL